MRILQIHDESWDSGIAHYALAVSEELLRRGHQIQFWGLPQSYSLGRAVELELATREIERPWLSLPALRREARELEFDVINAHTGSSHSLAAALAWGTAVPIVRTRADARPPSTHILAAFLARKTTAFIAATSRIAGEISAAFPEARVCVVYPGIPSTPLAAASRLPDSPVVGILGRLDPVKGHDDFMDAAILAHKSFPKARFLAAGEGRPERLSKLQWQLGYLGLKGTLEFLGRVPDAMAFIAGCRIGVVASTGSEAVSRAALEWMCMGRALVATAVGCLPELVSHEETGLLVAPGSPQQMSAAIERLLKDPALAESMGRKGKERFERRFSVRRLGAETEAVYEEAIHGARAER